MSQAPVIYSHSGLKLVWDCERNITDDQVRACAANGGVIGIPAIGIFLGRNEATIDAMVRHIDRICELVGPAHVGVGSDFTFEMEDAVAEMARNPHLFPESFTRYGPIRMVEPEQYPGVAMLLRERGYPEADVEAICDGNFRRVAQQVWR